MHYIVHGLDRPSAGALLAQDQTLMIGSCFLIGAEKKDVEAAFNRADPFYIAGIWQDIKIHPFLKHVDTRA
jgi:uncharacterized protein